MKLLVLVVNSSVLQIVTDELRLLGVAGFTVSPVEGHGAHTAEDRFLSARDRVVGFVPRVRIDIVLPAEQVGAVLDSLSAPDTGLGEHGTFWISAIDRFGQL